MSILSKIKSRVKKLEKTKPFIRTDLKSDQFKGIDHEVRKLINLLNYTKQSGAAYNGELYEIGYHTLNIGGKTLKGQRDPKQRLNNLNYDFNGKNVLDFGCNQGGMLHAIANQIAYGLGLDYDAKMINVGNRIASHNKSENLSFYFFNLETEPLDLIYDLSAVETFDMVFMLSISMWINNWKEVLDFGAKIGEALLFETNGTEHQQYEQLSELKRIFRNVTLIADRSEDDPHNKLRQLYFCNKD